MSARIIFTLCSFILISKATAQSNIATVSKIDGFYIFSGSLPIAGHDTVGDVLTMGNFDVRILRSKGQYGPVRDYLISAARKMSESADGLIITMLADGHGKASLIKFKQNGSHNSLSTVNQFQGMYIFTDSSPTVARQYLGTTSIRGKDKNVPYSTLLEKIVALSRKDHPKAEAIVLRNGYDDSISADILTFNWK